MKQSLYAKYVEERESGHVLEMPWGFVSYRYEKDHVYLEDLYVLPQFREQGKGMKLFSFVQRKARSVGLKYVVGGICTKARFATEMSKILLSWRCRLLSSEKDMIQYIKEV